MMVVGILETLIWRNSKTEIYGNLPYIAPEKLRKCPYTTSSDIYSVGILMWEILIEKPPFYNREHNNLLILDIIKGIRPGLVKEPRWYVSIMKRCWDAFPENRPTIDEIDKEVFPQLKIIFTNQTNNIEDPNYVKMYLLNQISNYLKNLKVNYIHSEIFLNQGMQLKHMTSSNRTLLIQKILSTDMSFKIDSEELNIDIIH
ncbi:kinase-like domain-containing protein [Gigaspora rosea]|uniref:Kinase-like domain-containing protein n=1 Tax=Gigaspora rosea TaxID=44941 RepID=A0A397W2R8_9GLOM|nr:kinase-like domain-containing protein [Gigaspora rosea]